MGMTAENVTDHCNVTPRGRRMSGRMISQTRAVAARESGHFDAEIVPVTVPAHKDDRQGRQRDRSARDRRHKDDGPRPGTTLEKLASLKPVFKEGGTVTAGNACPLNDGAAALLVMCDEKAAALGLKPQGAHHRLDRRRDTPGDHGPRPDPGDRKAAEGRRA